MEWNAESVGRMLVGARAADVLKEKEKKKAGEDVVVR